MQSGVSSATISSLQADEDQKNQLRMQELVEKLQGKLKQYKKMAESAVSVFKLKKDSIVISMIFSVTRDGSLKPPDAMSNHSMRRSSEIWDLRYPIFLSVTLFV